MGFALIGNPQFSRHTYSKDYGRGVRLKRAPLVMWASRKWAGDPKRSTCNPVAMVNSPTHKAKKGGNWCLQVGIKREAKSYLLSGTFFSKKEIPCYRRSDKLFTLTQGMGDKGWVCMWHNRLMMLLMEAEFCPPAFFFAVLGYQAPDPEWPRVASIPPL